MSSSPITAICDPSAASQPAWPHRDALRTVVKAATFLSSPETWPPPVFFRAKFAVACAVWTVSFMRNVRRMK